MKKDDPEEESRAGCPSIPPPTVTLATCYCGWHFTEKTGHCVRHLCRFLAGFN